MNETLYEFYKSNQKFKDYVDAYCICRGKGLFEALQDLIIKTVAEDIKDRAKGVSR